MQIDDCLDRNIQDIRLRHEFLTFLIMENEARVGIVQNETPKIIMFYDLEKIRDPHMRMMFLEFGDNWWWGRSQRVPIDRFIGNRFENFQSILVGYPKKSVKRLVGPRFNLREQYLKRVKKKRIELIGRPLASAHA